MALRDVVRRLGEWVRRLWRAPKRPVPSPNPSVAPVAPRHDSRERAGGTDAPEAVSVPPAAKPQNDASSEGARTAETATGGEVPNPSPPAPPKTVAEQEESPSTEPADGECPDALPDDVEATDPPRSEATPEPSKPQGHAAPPKDSRPNHTDNGPTSEPRDNGGRRRHGPQHDSRERTGGTDASEVVSVPPAAKPPSDASSGGARTATGGEVPDPSPPAPPKTVAKQEEPTSKQPATGESPDALPDDVEATDPPPPESAPEPSKPQGNAEPSKDSRPNRTASGSTSEPRDIGGRRRNGPANPALGRKPRPQPQPTSPPELICREYGSRWEVVLSASSGCQIEKVSYSGEPLDMESGKYRLSSLAGSLSVACNGKHVELPLYKEKPLIFKLRTNWKPPGRLVSSITNGHFLVIAPADWKRTGPCSVEPAGCVDRSFLAHYFHRGKNESLDDIGGFQEYDLSLMHPQIALEGKTVFDDSEEGILFGGSDPPRLRLKGGVVWARVGEESSNGWGRNFKPTEQMLAEVLDRREGRFFLRIFDKTSSRSDSCQFRYKRDLKEIRVNDDTYTEHTILAPSSTGHHPATVRFIGTDGAVIVPSLPTGTTRAHVTNGCLIADPHPDGDVVQCSLNSKSGSVDIALHLPRIWWRLESDASKPDDWRATPATLTRQQFQEYADSDTVLRVRLPRRFKSVGVGFDGDLEQKYYPKATEGGSCASLAVLLLHFRYHMQIDQRLHEDAFLNVEFGDTILPVVRIVHDPLPMITSFSSDPPTILAGEQATLHWAARNTDACSASITPDVGPVEPTGSAVVAPSTTTAYTLALTTPGLGDMAKTVNVFVNLPSRIFEELIARVRQPHGTWRRGKGFSYGEIWAAGTTVAHAKSRTIPVDRRRRSIHLANVDTIRRSLDA